MKQTARKGYKWVLTEKGYNSTPAHIKHERAIRKPVFPSLGYDESVPVSWVKKGYVIESEG